MRTRLKALWLAITKPQYVVTCDDGMYLLKEVWAWTVHKNTPWSKSTEQVLEKYFKLKKTL